MASNMDQQQRQAEEAALAVVRPGTDATTRAAASRFLEQWTLSEEAWSIYCQWLEAFATGTDETVSPEAVSVQLLCLQLLQSKIRREYDSENSAVPYFLLQSTLWKYVQSRSLPDSALQPACICIAALTVRSGNMQELLASICCTSVADSNTMTQLRLLSEIPLEMETVSELSSSRVTIELSPYHSSVLSYLLNAIQLAAKESKVLLCALQATKNWVQVGRITLSQLHSVANGSPDTSLLGILVKLLSSEGVAVAAEAAVYVQTARALQEAIMVPADSCTDSRNAACNAMMHAMAHSGFLVAALQHASNHEWEDAASAIASLATTFVTEEIDELVTRPAETLLLLLLQLQTHPVVAVRIVVLDCWLTISDIPVRQRHEHWQSPLFRQVSAALLLASRYTDETDEDDLPEFRRMSTDVLMSSYYLLRSEFVQHMVTSIVSGTDAEAEAALFALKATAREINTRIVSRMTGAVSNSLLARDRQRTADGLLQVLRHVCQPAMRTSNEVFEIGVAKFLGAFAASWSVHCSAEDIFNLLSFLQQMIVLAGRNQSGAQNPVDDSAIVVEAAKAIKCILVGCSSKILVPPPASPIPEYLQKLMETVLSCHCEDAMAEVAEGYTRLVIETKDGIAIRLLLKELVKFVVERCEEVMRALPREVNTLSEEAVLAIDYVARYLQVLQVIIQFSDFDHPAGQPTDSPLADIVRALFPFLESVSQRTSAVEIIFSKVLEIQMQLMKNEPDLVASYFHDTLKRVAEIFEVTPYACCLGYVSCAVEAYGSSSSGSFLELLTHLTAVFLALLKRSEEDSHSELTKGFFEMNQRYFLFCPSAFLGCPQFPAILFCAVEILASCEELEAKRASLNLLSQIFGWRTLRLSAESNACLRSAADLLDMQLMQHGARTTQCCIKILLGGSQALWPACTECIFAIMSTSVALPLSKDSESSIACQWIELACNVENAKVDVVKKVVALLLDFARQGPNSKPKAKLLLSDFCMIYRGELSIDALVSYSL